MELTAPTYTKEQFSKLSAVEETIENKVFDECEFTDCTLISCRFEKCRFLNCTFSKCDLSNMLPMNSEFREVKFAECKAIGIDWTRASKIKELSFKDCLVNYSNFRLLKIPKLVIRKCEAKDVDFIETDLTDANLRSSDFEETTFFKTNLTNADLSLAKNYSIDPNTNTLKKTKFTLPEALSLLSNLDIIVE